MVRKSQLKASEKYLKEKVETFVVRVPKGKKEIIEQRAKSLGYARNEYINKLIDKDLEK